MVVAIGKFEGIHLGHRALISEVTARARAIGVASAIIVFEPHPAKILSTPNYASLFDMKEREFLLDSLQVDKIIALPFDSALAATTPQDFCNLLFREIGACEVIVGENFRFGKNRVGTVELLRQQAAEYGGTVRVVPLHENVSTSQIRRQLAIGNLAEATKLLGFPFFIMGTVAQGRKLGRTLGFPTLNIYPPPDKFLPENGVYATRTLLDGKEMPSITNIGIRPTVANTSTVSVETHIPGLNAAPDELYNRHIKVDFLRFIRPERRFNSTQELTAQIQEDLETEFLP